MGNISFSIIIPIYNAEKTLDRCLDSILNQVFLDYEVLMIDDGSTDGSQDICTFYSSLDTRFKYYYQNNSGPSGARNNGLDNAIGEYITFVDSDDYVNENYLKELHAAFTEQDSDVVFMAYKLIEHGEKTIPLPLLKGAYYNKLITLSDANMFGYTWIKAFRMSIIQDIRFDINFNILEDEMFACDVLKQANSISIVTEAIYNYVKGGQSLIDSTHNNFSEACENVYIRWKNLLQDDDKRESSEYLKRKSNQLAYNCKYYGLEKQSNPIDFYKKLSIYSFFMDSTVEDELINSIKKNKWNKVKYLCNKYKVKNRIISFLK